jgi:hypothetical protein
MKRSTIIATNMDELSLLRLSKLMFVIVSNGRGSPYVEKRRAATTLFRMIRLNGYGRVLGVHLAIPIVEGVT